MCVIASYLLKSISSSSRHRDKLHFLASFAGRIPGNKLWAEWFLLPISVTPVISFYRWFHEVSQCWHTGMGRNPRAAWKPQLEHSRASISLYSWITAWRKASPLYLTKPLVLSHKKEVYLLVKPTQVKRSLPQPSLHSITHNCSASHFGKRDTWYHNLINSNLFPPLFYSFVHPIFCLCMGMWENNRENIWEHFCQRCPEGLMLKQAGAICDRNWFATLTLLMYADYIQCHYSESKANNIVPREKE